MKLKIYADRLSQPSRAVLIFCKLNGIDFEEITVDFVKLMQFSDILLVHFLELQIIGIQLISSKELRLTQCWIGITPIYAVVKLHLFKILHLQLYLAVNQVHM
ncbi:Glutathione S-transferase T1 [Camellia lanceoleosa]|uniref:Glutathione S-transferase T1 n=1 Tax=Camellia lanceoleosa TaxID=1840588 RepID=A0ACC0FFB6_9ERIC|nr:Glutathione S-transferase T1 [Camellia lanceoleosa]